jgi:hypothetical protein
MESYSCSHGECCYCQKCKCDISMNESRGSDAASNFEVNFWLMTIHLHEIVLLTSLTLTTAHAHHQPFATSRSLFIHYHLHHLTAASQHYCNFESPRHSFRRIVRSCASRTLRSPRTAPLLHLLLLRESQHVTRNHGDPTYDSTEPDRCPPYPRSRPESAIQDRPPKPVEPTRLQPRRKPAAQRSQSEDHQCQR